jgi:hypothetical protein
VKFSQARKVWCEQHQLWLQHSSRKKIAHVDVAAAVVTVAALAVIVVDVVATVATLAVAVVVTVVDAAARGAAKEKHNDVDAKAR